MTAAASSNIPFERQLLIMQTRGPFSDLYILAILSNLLDLGLPDGK